MFVCFKQSIEGNCSFLQVEEESHNYNTNCKSVYTIEDVVSNSTYTLTGTQVCVRLLSSHGERGV